MGLNYCDICGGLPPGTPFWSVVPPRMCLCPQGTAAPPWPDQPRTPIVQPFSQRLQNDPVERAKCSVCDEAACGHCGRCHCGNLVGHYS